MNPQDYFDYIYQTLIDHCIFFERMIDYSSTLNPLPDSIIELLLMDIKIVRKVGRLADNIYDNNQVNIDFIEYKNVPQLNIRLNTLLQHLQDIQLGIKTLNGLRQMNPHIFTLLNVLGPQQTE